MCVFIKQFMHLSNRLLTDIRMQLPEGVPEVNAPPFQLFRIVGCHMGKLAENIQVCGVT